MPSSPEVFQTSTCSVSDLAPAQSYSCSARDALVLAGGGLARLELLEVPVADLHVATVVVEALGELLGGAGAVVAAPLLLLLVLRLNRGLLLRRGGRLGGAAGEEAADGVADRGADGDTAAGNVCQLPCSPLVTLRSAAPGLRGYLCIEPRPSFLRFATAPYAERSAVERAHTWMPIPPWPMHQPKRIPSVQDPNPGRGGRKKVDLRSGAGHLAEQARAGRLLHRRRHLLLRGRVVLLRRGHGGRGPVLLRRGGSRGGRAAGGAADGALTRHDGLCLVGKSVVCVVLRVGGFRRSKGGR